MRFHPRRSSFLLRGGFLCALTLPAQWLAPDGLHPSPAAYRRMAELIRPLISF